jgi:hypothetical protein
VSLARISGSLQTTAQNIPETGAKQLEIGASRWRFLATSGGDIELFASPPSLRLLGRDALPDGIVRLRHTSAAGGQPEKWGVELTLKRDFKPWPDVLEIKKGFTKLSWQPAAVPPAFARPWKRAAPPRRKSKAPCPATSAYCPMTSRSVTAAAVRASSAARRLASPSSSAAVGRSGKRRHQRLCARRLQLRLHQPALKPGTATER